MLPVADHELHLEFELRRSTPEEAAKSRWWETASTMRLPSSKRLWEWRFGSGTDVARETGDVILLGNDLSKSIQTN
jgi:hypothetical protein